MHRQGEDLEHLFTIKFCGNLYDTMVSITMTDFYG
jgi:hypothetical protein